jgi:peptide/nickel transport system permease protein
MSRRLAFPPSAALGAALVLCALAAGLAAPLASQAAYEQDLAMRLKAPGEHGVLGTDLLGRDVFARILFGVRVSLLVAISAVAAAGSIGTVLGLVAGFFLGWWDDVIMRVADVFLSIPLVLLAITVMAAVRERGLAILILVIAGTQWMGYARTVRAETLALKQHEFVEAARALGAGSARVVFRHLLPGVLTTVVTLATLQVPVVILIEAGLSYLGLGVQPPDPSLGYMLQESRIYFGRAPWLAVFPGLALALLVLGINLLGDGLGAVINPRLRA